MYIMCGKYWGDDTLRPARSTVFPILAVFMAAQLVRFLPESAGCGKTTVLLFNFDAKRLSCTGKNSLRVDGLMLHFLRKSAFGIPCYSEPA